jgi:hypothetical protein
MTSSRSHGHAKPWPCHPNKRGGICLYAPESGAPAVCIAGVAWPRLCVAMRETACRAEHIAFCQNPKPQIFLQQGFARMATQSRGHATPLF